MSELFGFESDFVASLRCIPMAVRYRLDLAGVKLKLNEWSKLGQSERRRLLEMPVSGPGETAAYRDALSAMVEAACGAAPGLLPELPAPVWESPAVPDQVRAKAAETGVTLSDATWRSLAPLQRFALVKLSRPGHENLNFVPAAEEFGLRRT
jgi:hypothetical protein